MRFLNATTLVFIGIILLSAAWIGSGMVGREAPVAAPRGEPPLPRVAASWSEATPVTRELVLYGEVEPAQISILRARVDGIVEETASQGETVEAGQTLVQLSTDDREARLARAQAQLASAQRDYEAARSLADQNVGPEAEAQARLAQLEAARAELRAVELEIGNTSLRAPIRGVINRLIADVGAYVSAGGEVLEIIDNDPLVAVVSVQQAQILNVRVGMEARVRFIGGGERAGTVRFISPIAEAATRTFRVEVQIGNEDGAMPSGLSVEVAIPYDTVAAHRVSAALGRLNEDGEIGLHLLDDEDRIVFVPIEVVRARADGIWVAGLPERARIITVSQGTLSPGQRVEVRETPPEYGGEAGLVDRDGSEAARDAVDSQADGADGTP